MKRQLMVYAAIAAFALPTLAPLSALAQERGDRGQDDRAQAPQRDRNRPGSRAPEARPGPRPTAEAPREQQQPRPDRGPHPERPSGGGDRPERPNGGDAGQNRPDRPDTGQRPDRPSGGWQRPDRPEGSRPGGARPDAGQPGSGRPDAGRPGSGRPDGGRPDSGRPGAGRPDNGRPDRPGGGWNNGRPGQDRPNTGRPGAGRPGQNWDRDRDRRRQEYRNRFDSQRWQRDWHRSRGYDWWRNDRRFRSWGGIRIGFYFAPGYGYYSVPRQYYGQHYQVGQYLPEIFWRYRLDDYRTYGLGYPPEGARWVYVDNSVYLIDDYDGYIIDVVRDFWRW